MQNTTPTTAKFHPVMKVAELTPKYVQHKEVDAISLTINSAYQAANILRNFYDKDQLCYREFFYAMYLNRSNKVIAVFKASEGGISSTLADPKIILAQALLCGASGVLLSHNHPSGNTKPSEEDKALTQKIKNACSYLDLHLIDHVILTECEHLSFAEEGLI